MSRVTRFASIFALGVGTALIGCSSSPTTEDSTAPSEPSETVHEATRFRAGDLVERNGVSAIAPPAGMSVAGIFEFVDSEKQILVSTDAAGRVWLDARTVTVTNDDVTECASPAECTDTAYVLEPWRWTSSFHYYFNGGSTPSYLLKSDVSSDIFQATTNIISARNNCGRADYIDASYVYEGYTTRWANITGTPSCATPDGYSVTSFGTQPAGNLANTCTWYNSSGTASESDTVINNTGVSWFTGVTPAGCTTKYSINDVMTHERGHTYGLNHPGSCHANLTMYASEGPCTLRNTTLGLGDMLGLGVLY